MIIKINTENVVIGSGSIAECEFQIMNFMNMLYNNIHYSDNRKGGDFSTGECMTAPIVYSNLMFFLKKYESVADLCYSLCHIGNKITAIYVNLDMLKYGYKDIDRVKALCDHIWLEACLDLKDTLKIKFECIK